MFLKTFLSPLILPGFKNELYIQINVSFKNQPVVLWEPKWGEFQFEIYFYFGYKNL